jgi:oligopeptide transport system substrate-binding protein
MIRTLIAVATLATAAPTLAQSKLHRGNTGEPTTLDPQKFGLSLENTIMSEMFEGLVTTNDRDQLIPGLAESWTLSPDGKVYTFKLRPNLKWSDGKPITAEDAAFGLRRALDPKVQGSFGTFLVMIENAAEIVAGKLSHEKLGVHAVDARTLEIRLVRPTPTLLLYLANWPMTFPVPKHAVIAASDWARPGKVVVSGPYNAVSWRANDSVRLVRSPSYHGAAQVKTDEVIMYPTSDDAAALTRFRAKELDMNTRFPPTQIDWLRKNLPNETKVSPAMGLSYLVMNFRRKPFDDLRVRKALALGIDRPTVTDKLLRNGERPSCGIIPFVIADYKSACTLDARPMAVRQAEAKALLAEAGFGPAKPLTFVLSQPGSQSGRQVAVALQAMWSQIGAKVEIVQAEAGVHFDKLRKGEFDVALAGWFANPDPEFFTYLLKKTSVEVNYGAYDNPKFDAAVTAAETIVDRPKRMAAFKDAEAMALADQAMIPLLLPVHRLLLQTYVKGVTPNPGGGYPSRYISVQRPGAAAP